MHDNTSLRGIIVQIFNKGEFPDGAFDLRDIESIKSFKTVSDKRVRFKIRSRLALGDRTSPGKSLSAYIPKTYVFEFDSNTEQVILVEMIENGPVIHFRLLAIEEVEKYFEQYQVHERKLKRTSFKKDVIEYAERELAKIINDDDFGNAIKIATEEKIISEGSFNRFLAEFKEQYIAKMVHQWLILRNLQESL